MREFIGGWTIIWCASMYWLGGQEIPGLRRGYKWIRRYVLPAGLLVFLYAYLSFVAVSVPFWKPLVMCLGLSCVTHVGYQDKWWKFILVGFLFALPTFVFGWTVVSLLPCVFHSLFGMVSLRDDRFGWSFVAILTGAAIGVSYLYAVGG